MKFEIVLYICKTKQLTMSNEILTTTLRNGQKVLAKKDKYGINAVTFVNDTQANTKSVLLLAMGISSFVIKRGPVQYLAINN